MPEQLNHNMWQYLKDYGVVEAILAIFTIVLGVVAVYRAQTDKAKGVVSSQSVVGQHPVGSTFNQYSTNEALQIIRDIREDNRERNRMLDRMEHIMVADGKVQWDILQVLRSLEDINQEKIIQERQQTMLLEDLRNNQVMRSDASQGIPRRKL